MLAYAFRIKPDGTSAYDTEKFEKHTDILGIILLHSMEAVLKKGLIKYYSDHSECTATPHGKINLAASIKSGSIGRNELICEYQLYDEQTYSNQIVKSIIDKICKYPDLDPRICSGLKDISKKMSMVETIDCASISWNKATYNGFDRDYRMALHVCRLFVEDMIPHNAIEGQQLRSYISEKRLFWLFEEFVRGYFEVEHKTIYKTQRKLDWGSASDILQDLEMDILLRNENHTLIIDAKYYSKILDGQYTKRVRSNHLLQLNGYLDSWIFKHPGTQPAGMLLYAKTDEIFEEISTNIFAHPISIKTLDLSADWGDIKQKLDSVAASLESGLSSTQP